MIPPRPICVQCLSLKCGEKREGIEQSRGRGGNEREGSRGKGEICSDVDQGNEKEQSRREPRIEREGRQTIVHMYICWDMNQCVSMFCSVQGAF